MTFIRFTVPSDEVRIEPHVAAGLFHATYRLVRDGRFEEGERLWFAEEMEWFNQFLPATRGLPTWRAVCWFRGDAGEAISRIWRIVDIVEGEGVPVRVFRTRRPGEIVYADAFQVAAVPWRDSFTARPNARQTSSNPRRPRLRCGSVHARIGVTGRARARPYALLPFLKGEPRRKPFGNHHPDVFFSGRPRSADEQYRARRTVVTPPAEAELARQFIATFQELESNAFSRDSAVSARSAAALRRLLMDSNPLATRVASISKEKLRLISPLTTGAELSLSQFLATELKQAGGVGITAADVIRYFSHVDGAVHAGMAKSPPEKALQQMRTSDNRAEARWPLQALLMVAAATLDSLRPLRDRSLDVTLFDNVAGTSIYVGLVLRPMGGDRENTLLDLGGDRHRDRLTIFIDSDDRLCVRLYDVNGQRIVLASPPTPVAFSYGEPFLLEAHVGTLEDEILVRIRTPRWQGAFRQHEMNAQAIKAHLRTLVIGSDLEGVGRSKVSVCELLVYDRVQSGAAYVQTREYAVGRVTTLATWVVFDEDKFMYSKGHPKLAAAANDSGAFGLIQSDPKRRPSILQAKPTS